MRIRTKVGIGFLLIIIGVILSRPVIEFLTHQNPLPGNNPEDELSSERTRIMSPDVVLKLLNPPQGSTILDLGAGFGMYAFRLGQAVGPNGKVFATDVDSQAIAYLNERARKEGYSNIIPVQVSGHGVDSFYRDHKFDLILASDVITEIRFPEKFFDDLRPSLKEETGRLWIVNLKPDPDFTIVELNDLGVLRSILLSGKKGPAAIVNRLSTVTKTALSSVLAPEQVTALLIQDLNKMLEDPTLWPEINQKKWKLNQQEAVIRQFLIENLDNKGVFTSRVGVTDDIRRVLRMLNRLIIMDILESTVWGKAIVLNKLSKSQLEPLLAPLTFPTFWGRPTFFDEAGYELVQEHNNIAYCSILELKRKR